MKNFMLEFRQFIARGNVVDLAVGLIIGASFQKIISSLVGDVAMPAIGMLSGNINFTAFHVGPLAIGNFIQASIDFLIVAFVVFLAIKAFNRLKQKDAVDETAKVNRQEALLIEIRDLLKTK